ncbi:ead/Ea22-like family protein [Citrobacter freundii]|uniref:ead/Ea22-like family protein n=1 Tax=Citrobacter TaxID=544 RepID=UPI001A304AA0|nr:MULTISPECIES: ead/Ea22-like family protein [Citrobacter]MCT4734363.1 ead/Ea22-like family protein [Citrobacter freundii]MDE9714844.1 ead/Ea22-like family protein [Citrobacter freundii]MDE9724975.1 ead/Ea22-like family protein [Citrobacter freundii]MDE9734656.1 ead/Ea22-like family protein [Citrobacter freundii]MDT7134265.1 ead/Ea22-like family protein [Citrobacter freundii]
MTALNKRALRKAAMHAKTEGDWGCDADNFHDKATPDAVLALLDELEAKDKSIGFLKDQLAQLANFNPDWDRLEAAIDSLREHMAKLSAAEKRIAELEARTVCLPKLPVLGSNAEWYEGFAAGASGMRNECADAIRAAGIGVKGE